LPKSKFDLKAIEAGMEENGSVTLSYKKHYIETKTIVDATLTLTDVNEMRNFVKYITGATKTKPQTDVYGATWYLI
jgi:hypothetical protein